MSGRVLMPSSGSLGRLDPKAVATLKARCALVGVELHVGDDDSGAPLLIVSRWSLTRQLHSVDELETFLRRMGEAPAA